MQKLRMVIVDYGMGNIRSVANAFTRLGCEVAVTESAQDFSGADALILPGVGAFGEAMSNLNKLKLVDPIIRAVHDGKPLLGICLGMQLLAETSEERGNHKGLGLISGKVQRIPVPKELRLPHVGWNAVSIRQRQPLFADARDGESFYFVHSYHFVCPSNFIAATADYGGDVVAAVQRGHVFGVQFHPERSQASGLRLLNNFVQHVGSQQKAVAC